MTDGCQGSLAHQRVAAMMMERSAKPRTAARRRYPLGFGHMKHFSRRQAVFLSLAVPLVPLTTGCRGTLPAWSVPASDREAFALLKNSANAHGLLAYTAIND